MEKAQGALTSGSHLDRLTYQIQIYHLRNTLEAAILGMEIDICSPVVGEALAEGAGDAGRPFREVILDLCHGAFNELPPTI